MWITTSWFPWIIFCIFLLLFVQNSTFQKNLSNLFMGLCLVLDSWWFWSQVFNFRSSCLVQNFEDTLTIIKIYNIWKIIIESIFSYDKKKKKQFLIVNLGTNLSQSYVNSMGNSSWVEFTQSTWLVNSNLFHFYLGLSLGCWC
jgi:hypothetical protein